MAHACCGGVRQRLVEHVDYYIRLFGRQHQRRTDLQYVMAHGAGTQQYAFLPHPVHHLTGQPAVGCAALPIRNQFHADKQARPPDIADGFVPVAQAANAFQQPVPGFTRMRNQSLSLNGIQHRQGRRAGNSITGKGIEVAGALPKLRQHVGCGQ
ncbi:hypothetical protein C7433_101517 [Pantoea sp. PNA 03-3]|nr:hypothetical protein C7433_101517 [Pantoea sp. PNA 03-3]